MIKDIMKAKKQQGRAHRNPDDGSLDPREYIRTSFHVEQFAQ